MHEAIYANKASTMRLLLDNKADHTIKDNQLMTPIDLYKLQCVKMKQILAEMVSKHVIGISRMINSYYLHEKICKSFNL